MRRVITMSALALLLLPAVAATALGSHNDSPGGPPRDFAAGAGTVGSESGDPFGAQRVAFGATGGPTGVLGGDPVRGHFRAGGEFLDPEGGNNEIGEFQQEGPVTCLVVEGNTARLVYPVKQGRFQGTELNEDSDVLIFLQDNGRPSNGQAVDEIGFAVLPDETPDSDPPSEQDNECVPPFEGSTTPLEKGNFTVHDADPSDTLP